MICGYFQHGGGNICNLVSTKTDTNIMCEKQHLTIRKQKCGLQKQNTINIKMHFILQIGMGKGTKHGTNHHDNRGRCCVA